MGPSIKSHQEEVLSCSGTLMYWLKEKSREEELGVCLVEFLLEE